MRFRADCQPPFENKRHCPLSNTKGMTWACLQAPEGFPCACLAFFSACCFRLRAHAACEGRDLRRDLSPEDQAALDKTLDDIAFPEGNHWIATKNETVLHLIGTLHTNDVRMGPVVDRLAPVLSRADAFYFEVTKTAMDAFERDLAKDFSPVLITSGPNFG